MQTSQKDGMVTMEKSIEILIQNGVITGVLE
jgi:Tfp pilus assembly pilus retraction ATPase PilT